MPYPVNINSLEIKLFYQIYGEKNSKPDEEEYFDADDEDELENLETLLQTEQINLDFQDQQNDSTPTSFIKSLFDTAWECANYACNHPFQTFTLILVAYSATNTHCLFENIFEAQEQFSNSINTATNILSKLAVAQFATRGQLNPPLKMMITGMSLWNPVAATTPEFLVNTYTTNTQEFPSVATLSDGNFLVAWSSYGQDNSNYGIFAQRLNGTNGVKLGPELLVNTYTTDNQLFPAIACLQDGNYVITWDGYGMGELDDYGIYSQRFSGTTHAKLGSEFRVNTYTTGPQRLPSISNLSNGGFVITWTGKGSDEIVFLGVYAQIFNSAGEKIGNQFQVNTLNSHTGNPYVIGLSNNNFVVFWQQDMLGLQDVYWQRFNNAGVKLGLESLLNTSITDQRQASIANLSDGNFVAMWWRDGDNIADNYIVGQRFNETNGVKLNGEFLVETFTNNYLQRPSVTKLSNGSFVVVWYDSDESGFWNIYGQRFNEFTNEKVGSKFQANIYTYHHQYQPCATSFSDGSFVVAWQSYEQAPDVRGSGIFARIFTPPRLDNNTLTISIGNSKILTSIELSASAPKTDPGTLIFTAINVTHGNFTLVSNPGLAILNFTQHQVIDGQIKFVHDGSAFAPSYFIKVNEVVLDTTPSAATIIFTTPIPTPTTTPSPADIPTTTPTPIPADPTPTPTATISNPSTPAPIPISDSTPTPTPKPMSDPTATPTPISPSNPINISQLPEYDGTVAGILTAAGATFFLSALGFFGYRKVENAKEVKQSVDNITKGNKPSYSPAP